MHLSQKNCSRSCEATSLPVGRQVFVSHPSHLSQHHEKLRQRSDSHSSRTQISLPIKLKAHTFFKYVLLVFSCVFIVPSPNLFPIAKRLIACFARAERVVALYFSVRSALVVMRINASAHARYHSRGALSKKFPSYFYGSSPDPSAARRNEMKRKFFECDGASEYYERKDVYYCIKELRHIC